jgi:cytochrome c oxidase subunit 2
MGAANRNAMPNSVFSSVSTPAYVITNLAFFGLLVVAGIFLTVGGLLAWSIVRFRQHRNDDGSEPPQIYGSNPIEFAWTAVPVLIAFVLILTTARTIFTLQEPAHPPGSIHVVVIGHQWWWEFRYPDQGVVTANELHVPLSDRVHPTPTFLTLESADVAHSFWVPRLAGKTDVIPNRKNTMWIDPHVAGVYLGQCGEFCGTEHAMMLIRVIVEPRGQFDNWVLAQRRTATTDPSVNPGRAIFESTACVNCHTVAGTDANGRFGPDLTHLMSRQTIGAGAALNTPETLRAWVNDPDTIKPGALMPAMNLNAEELNAVVAYLETLK